MTHSHVYSFLFPRDVRFLFFVCLYLARVPGSKRDSDFRETIMTPSTLTIVMATLAVFERAVGTGDTGTASPGWSHFITGDPKDPSILPSPFTHGVVLRDKGPIQFSEGAWTLVVHWNVTPTEHLIRLMRDALDNVTHHGGHLNETSFNTSYWNAVTALDLTNSKCQDVQDLLQGEAEPYPLGELKREKRWTSLEHFLGLATTDDIQQVQAQLARSMESAQQIFLQEANQLRAELTIVHDLATDHQHLENLGRMIQGLQQGVHQLATQEQRMTGHTLQLVAYGRITEVANAIRDTLDTVEKVILTLHQGRLPPDLISPSKMRQCIQLLLQKQPEGLTPIIDLRHLARYYSLPLTSVHTSNGSLTARVCIPLSKPGSHGRLYFLQPFPYYSADQVRQWRKSAGHLAINLQQQQQILLPEESEFPRECWGENPTICPTNYPRVPLTTDHCIDNLFNQGKSVDPLCAPLSRPTGELPRLYSWKDGFWVVAAPIPVDLVIQCARSQTKIKRTRSSVNGSCVLYLPTQCTANIGPLQIHRTKEWRRDLGSSPIGNPYPSLDADLFTFLNQQTDYNLSTSNADIERELQALGSEDASLDHVRLTLQKYLNKTERLAQALHPYGHPTQHAAISLWILVLLVAVVYATWKCYRRTCGKPTADPRRTEETRSVVAPPRRRQPPRALTFEMSDIQEVSDLTSSAH